jgi:hypothetical protein
MKLFIIHDHDFIVEDENHSKLGTFTKLDHAKLFCDNMFRTGRAETVYGIDGQVLMGTLDHLLADVNLIHIE